MWRLMTVSYTHLDIIIIDGVPHLHGTRHQVIPDRIEAGTYIALARCV